MAGAGYKLFNTGDVLTAAQVNTYLMEQTVMVFDDAAARTTALSGVLSEGMISYLKDTNAVEVYNGSAWVASDDPNAIQNTIVDAKGDLISATAADTPARLASSGNNGDVLTVDTSTSTGLKWAAPAAGGDTFAAGKNKVINGDFRINQRAFSSITATGYGFDRFYFETSGGTVTHSAQTFTPGTAPVAGYEGINFARIQTTSHSAAGDYTVYYPILEDARNLAGRTATVSFWAKAASGTPKVAFEFNQTFGTGGSPSSAVNTYVGQATLSTSWTRYSFTFSVPSVSGKTFGTNNNSKNELHIWVSAGSNFNSRTGTLGVQNNTFDFWGVQFEAGSSATDFQTATGTLAGELAACQRYFYMHAEGNNKAISQGAMYTASEVDGYVPFKVTMRTAPTLVQATGTGFYVFNRNSASDAFNSFILYATSTTGTQVYNNTEISGTVGHAGMIETANASASLAFSAEL